jgi:C4-dicarboxylate-specific signal transduction histidine kinase
MAHEALERTEQQLLHSEKMASLGRLVAGVAHKPSSPTSLVLGNVHAQQRHTERHACLAAIHGEQPANEQVRLTLRDNGPGIAAEHLSRVFDPFFTTKPVGAGTGLGLSISYGIVEQHGGELMAASARGGGAVFTLQLPRVE